MTQAARLTRSILPPPHFRFKVRAFVTMSNTPPAASEADAVIQQKRALRTEVRKQLRAMSRTQREEEDTAIRNIILEASWFKSSSRLCAYISCDALREVDTSKILAEVLRCQTLGQKKLFVPWVEDKNSHMRMFNITGIEDLIPNSMNILEPSPFDADGNQREDVMQANDPVDLLLLPGLAFDRSGRRLGRGGGYYDVFLRNYQELASERKWKQPLLVSLAYSVQVLDDEVVTTPNDVPVDALVSPAGVIPITPAAMERM